MSQNWDYAKLSKAAKAAGGPDKYVEMLELTSRNAGRMEMRPWIGATAVGAMLVTAASIKCIDYFKSKKKKNEIEIAKAKEEIINGIKEYDAMHLDEEGGSKMSERFPEIDWYCDRCNAYLNDQSGFDDHHYVWKCTECSHKNSISSDDIYESEEDFRNFNK